MLLYRTWNYIDFWALRRFYIIMRVSIELMSQSILLFLVQVTASYQMFFKFVLSKLRFARDEADSNQLGPDYNVRSFDRVGHR